MFNSSFLKNTPESVNLIGIAASLNFNFKYSGVQKLSGHIVMNVNKLISLKAPLSSCSLEECLFPSSYN